MQQRLEAASRQIAALQSQLQQHTGRDPLTGLLELTPFMNSLNLELGRAGRYGRPVAVVRIDIDNFALPQGPSMVRIEPEPNPAWLDLHRFKGEDTVTQQGVDGVQTTTYRVTVTDGVETGRQQLSTAVQIAPD